MKFVCLGYADENLLASMSPDEMKQAMEKCFDYDDELRRCGHFLGGEALGSVASAVTLRMLNGRVAVTDGPFTESKETLGGILILEARDLDHAIALMSKHPGVGLGPFEIRAADETIHRMIADRDAAITGAARD